MARKIVVGSIVNKVGFEVDKKSWSQLNKFQKRLSQLKAQMKGLSGGLDLKLQGGGLGKLKADSKKIAKVQADAHLKERKRFLKRSESVSARQTRQGIALDGLSGKVSPEAIAKAKVELERLSTSYKKATISASQYSAQSQRVVTNLKRQAGATRNLNQRFLDLRHSMLGLGILGAGVSGGVGVTQIGQSFEAMSAKMLAATGGQEQATRAMAMVRKESKRLGLDLLQASDAYARLGIAAAGSLDTSQTDELFTSFSELATSFKIAPEQQKRGLRAIEQMLNKGQLMAEEVKGQFAESIPGGIKVFADALGMSVEEFFAAMEAGELLAKDTLPLVAKKMAEVARNGGALDQALQGNVVAFGRMKTEWQELANVFFTSGFGEMLRGIYNSLADLAVAGKPIARFLSKTLAVAFDTLTFPIRFLIALIADLVEYFNIDWDNAATSTLATLTGLTLGFIAFFWTIKKVVGGIMLMVSALGLLKKAKDVVTRGSLRGGAAGAGGTGTGGMGGTPTPKGGTAGSYGTGVGKQAKGINWKGMFGKAGLIGAAFTGAAMWGKGVSDIQNKYNLHPQSSAVADSIRAGREKYGNDQSITIHIQENPDAFAKAFKVQLKDGVNNILASEMDANASGVP